MRAVWMLLSRRIAVQLAFLLVIVGYNLRKDRTLNDRLYLVYVIIFFSIWIFSVLILFASWAASILLIVGQAWISSSTVTILLLAVAIWSAVKLWEAANTSPFVFSEEDGLLLCQTPVNRRAVAVLWFLYAWVVNVLPFLGLAIVFGFVQVEISAGKHLGVTDLPFYWAVGLRAFFAMAFAHLLAMALVWLFGLARLRSDRDIPHYRWMALAIIALFAAATLSTSVSFGYLISPWKLAMESGMGKQPWYLAGLVAGLPAFGVISLLWLFADRLNLSRAAQETAYVQQMQAARWLGDSDSLAVIQMKRRLGSSHSATRLPVPQGAAVIFWREMLQNIRGMLLANLWQLALILYFTVFIILTMDVGSGIKLVPIWVLFLSQFAANRMRATLRQFWLWTQLPVNMGQEVIWQVFPTGLLLVAFNGLTMLIIPVSYPFLLLMLMVVATILVMLAGILDIIRQASVHSEWLAIDSVPTFTIIGVVIAIVALALPFWFYLQPFSYRSYFLILGWGIIEIVLMWLWIVHLWKKRK